MKVSLNWVQQYLGFKPKSVDELAEKIGGQLGAIEEIEHLGEKYQGIVVAKIVSLKDHEASDHLHIAMIDDGGVVQNVARDADGHVQVVCGASNLFEGMLVVWLPPGTTVPETVGKEPFVLEARELRGAMSNGMLASSRELALGTDHSGILGIDDPNAKPGDDFAKIYQLDDYILDIENKMFTHRPDCFGELGVAREIAGIYNEQFSSPDWYVLHPALPQPTGETLPLKIQNELPSLVPRFVVAAMSGINIHSSPIWLQTYLLRLGVRPINNIVDLTNYYMMLTGQPLHAYDYDKVKALSSGELTLVIRYPRSGEKIKLLNGKEIEPRTEAIMIATDQQLIGVGGIMGGADTEVDDNTKNIILECGTFDMYSVRRTSMAQGLFTDAVARFNKGQSPLQNLPVIAKVIADVTELAGGVLAGDVQDDSQVGDRVWVHPAVPVTTEFINTRLGLNLSAEDMKQLLENVEFKVEISSTRHSREGGNPDNDNWIPDQVRDDVLLTVTAPFWRTDIELREDVVEEIGRLYGYDKLPLILPKRDITPAPHDPMLDLKSVIRERLARAGANEALTYSFVHGDLLDKVGQDKIHAFQISNAISPDLQYYRLSLTPNLLDLVHANGKAGYDAFALFEIGRAHYKGEMDHDEPDVPNEDTHVALVVAYSDKQRPKGAPYYHARKYLGQIFDLSRDVLTPMSAFDLASDEWGRQFTSAYEPARSALIVRDGQIWGVVGEFKASVRRALKLPAFAAGFEVHTGILTPGKINYQPLPRFPKIEQDICLKVASDVSYRQVYDLVWGELDGAKPEQTFMMLGPVDIYQRDDDQAHKQITLRLSIASYERTLTDQEVTKLFDDVAAVAKEKLDAERI